MGSTDVRRLRTAGVTALACLLLLAGCGGDDPAPLVADPPASPSATPTPTASAAPEPWEERSKAGAVAFVEHWVEVFNRATADGDTRDLESLAGSECRSCQNFADVINDLYARGGAIETEGWRVTGVALDPASTQKSAQGAVNIRRQPQLIRKGDGTVERFDGGEATMSFNAEWRRGGWRMTELVLL